MPPTGGWKRREDRSQTGTQIALLLGVLAWAGAFCTDMAAYETFTQVWTPKFLGIHFAQLAAFLGSLVAARRLQ